jgi:putative transposase
MARPLRLHVPNGIYYVQFKVNTGQALLRDAQDVSEFNQLVANALSLTDARLHAYCWTSTDAHLALQISEVPIGRLVQLITGPYARRVHRRLGQSGALFQRYRTVLVTGELYLLKLVRYIHGVPARRGLASEPSLYPWSSYQTYLGNTKQSWVHTADVRQILARRGLQTRDAYVRWMAKPLSTPDVVRFNKASRCIPLRLLHPDNPEPPPLLPAPVEVTPASLQPLIDAVCRTLDVTQAELASPSRRHRVTLARALVAWHAVRSGMGTLKNIADCLGRHPSTLTMAIAHYKKSRSALFETPVSQLQN